MKKWSFYLKERMPNSKSIQKEALNHPFARWLLEHWKVTSGEKKGEPYSFNDYPFLIQIVLDDHPFKVYQKSSQCGISELNVAEMFFLAEKEKGNSGYIFPAGPQMEDFSKGRILPVFEEEYFKIRTTGVVNVSTISYNGCMFYLRGSTIDRQTKTIDLRNLFLDEVDEMELRTVHLLDKRLGASEGPRRRYFSTPTYKAIGINEFFEKSTQCEWFIRCFGCGERQFLTWEDNVIKTSDGVVKTICKKCKRDLDRLQFGEWIAAFPDRNIHGYHISKLFSPKANLNELWDISEDPSKEMEFHNHDLGKSYEPKGARLRIEDLNNARGNHILQAGSQKQCTIGIDVGTWFHVRISELLEDNKRKAVYIGRVQSYDELKELISRFNVVSGVIDAMPDTTAVTDFVKLYDGKIRKCYFEEIRGLFKQSDSIENTVIANRTQWMGLVATEILAGRNILPEDAHKVDGGKYYEHMRAPIRVEREDAAGERRYYYPRPREAFDYYMCELYDLLAGKFSSVTITQKLRGWFR